MTLQFEAALLSDTGQVRPLNEDAIGMDPAARLFVLADGLGGYKAGEIASAMAVSSILARLGQWRSVDLCEDAAFDAEAALREAIVGINADIHNAAANSTAYAGMATTLVVAWLLGRRRWVAHAGDSRLYRLRSERLQQITRDHSFNQELLDAGMVTEAEARQLPAKNLVTRALGADAELEPEIHAYDAAPGDLLLLCSDGLSEMIGKDEIAAWLATAHDDIQGAARRLVAMANQAGGCDNVSVLIVRLMASDAA
ncbi:MAG: Stp1/IreP family PP2C-type Ser/Thr phosphatase [Burkholderiaceae bacterium]